MPVGKESKVLPLRAIQIEDPFWSKEIDLVRRAVLPYQWRTLHDQVPGAAPSYCVHNFQAAARLTARQAEAGADFTPPSFTFRGFEVLPPDPDHPDPDSFYGFVFQDSDLYKWVEAVACALSQHPDPDLEEKADRLIDLVCSAQQPDGYLDTYYILGGLDAAFTNLRDHHELYCFGHLAEGAAAYWQATGKDKLLRAACRFADLIDERFRDDGGLQGYPGHEIAEMALFRLYEVTGEDRYRALAQRFLDRRGRRPYYFDTERNEPPAAPEELRYQYHQAHLPVREQTEAVGHAVRAMYLYSGMADSARLTGDDAMWAACRALWRDVTGRKMYVTGGVGSTVSGEAFTFAYDLPNDTAYSETCAAVGLVFFARRMLQAEPRAAYADVMERALYNGVLAGMSADGEKFFYVNPLEVRPDACERDPHKSHVQPERQPWFGCACCPPNLARLVMSVGQYAWTYNEDTLYVHLYLGGQIQVPASHGTVTVRAESELPRAGNYTIRFMQDCPEEFTLAVRIPHWCGEEYSVDSGKARRWEKDGYLYLRKRWKAGDTLEFRFWMSVRLITANPAVWEDAGKLCVTRGPLVYCLEEADNGPGLHLLRLNPYGFLHLEDREIAAGQTCVGVTAFGLRETASPAEPLYGLFRPSEMEPASLRFIPYYLWANRGRGEMRVWVAAMEGKPDPGRDILSLLKEGGFDL
ncbi:MAG: glycoside hydrolase family 127 protein [Oscillospiraceae bacterium]|nr:glycoside hydrolase family 127 protein [Oscillospiraceae bacterium]